MAFADPKIGCRPAWTPLLCLALVLLVAVRASAGEKPSVREVLAGTVLAKKAKEVARGKKATVQAHEASAREMAVALACLIPAGRRGSLAHLHNAEPIMPEEYRDVAGPIDLRDIEGSLAGLTIGSEAEARRYLAAKPGWDLSLSAEEIAAFRALDPPKGQALAAVDATLRRIFAARIRDYHAKGLDGIAPFDRGGGKTSSVAEDLRRSSLASESFRKVLPDTHRALLAYPLRKPPGGRIFYFWTRIRVLGRPVFLLNQRLAADLDGGSVVIERQFYATQFLGAGQTLTALVPVREGTLVAYVNHSFVDRWTGPGVGTPGKRKVGFKLIDKILKEMADEYGLCKGVD